MKKGVWNFALPDTELVKLGIILKELCIGKSTWYDGIKAGRFPKPVKLTVRTSAWRTKEVRALIDGNL
jgi:prophage regulatory protein